MGVFGILPAKGKYLRGHNHKVSCTACNLIMRVSGCSRMKAERNAYVWWCSDKSLHVKLLSCTSTHVVDEFVVAHCFKNFFFMLFVLMR